MVNGNNQCIICRDFLCIDFIRYRCFKYGAQNEAYKFR